MQSLTTAHCRWLVFVAKHMYSDLRHAGFNNSKAFFVSGLLVFAERSAINFFDLSFCPVVNMVYGLSIFSFSLESIGLLSRIRDLYKIYFTCDCGLPGERHLPSD